VLPACCVLQAMRALSEALASIQRVEAFLMEVVPTDAEGAVKATRAGVKIVSGWLCSTIQFVCSFGHVSCSHLMHM
jgi:hypothetical protein